MEEETKPKRGRPKKDSTLARNDVMSINALVKQKAADISLKHLANLSKIALNQENKPADRIKASEILLYIAGGRPTAGHDVNAPTQNLIPNLKIVFGKDLKTATIEEDTETK
jgi:hypothetical protein